MSGVLFIEQIDKHYYLFSSFFSFFPLKHYLAC